MKLNSMITSIIIEQFREYPLKIRRMNLGFINEVYDVVLENDNVILRLNEDCHRFKGVNKNINALRMVGLPVPQFIKADLSKKKYGMAYVILRKIPGCDLKYEIQNMSKDDIDNLAEQIFYYQSKVGQLSKGKGFGRTNIDEQAGFDTWTEFILSEADRLLVNIDKFVGKEYFEKIYDIIKSYKSYMDNIEAVCFLDDISIKNVIVKDKKLQGFIDFDWVCYGDPLFMIGLVQISIMINLDQKCMYYFEKLCRLWNVDLYKRRIIDLYSLINAAEFLKFEMYLKDDIKIHKIVNSIKYFCDKWGE